MLGCWLSLNGYLREVASFSRKAIPESRSYQEVTGAQQDSAKRKAQSEVRSFEPSYAKVRRQNLAHCIG